MKRIKYVTSNLCKLLIFIGVFIVSISSFAMNGRTTYQAKIIKPDGQPLQASSVNFRFTVLDTVGSCILYVEDYSAVNMGDTGGLISFALGNGTRSFPTSGTSLTFQNTFDNSVISFPCQNTGIYNPGTNDTRKVVMQFNDGNGWQTLPAMTINAVPYAMYSAKANDSRTLNGKSDTAFVENSTLAALNCNTSTHAITYNGASFSCIAVGSGGGGGGGGINSVTTSGSVLVTGGTASAPVISIMAASISQSGYLTSVDYAEFKAKLSASSTQIASTLGYTPVSGAAVAAQIESAASVSATANAVVKRDASGNSSFSGLSANTASLNYVDIYKPSSSFNIRLQAPTSLSANYTLNLPTTSGTSGQVLSTDGIGNLSWINPAGGGSVISVSGTANEIISSGGANPNLGLANMGTAGTYFKVITDAKGRVTSGVTTLILSDLPASVLSTASNFNGDISGMISNITVNRIQGVSVTTSSLTTNDILQFDGSKYVNKNIPSCSVGQYLTFNGTNFTCVADSGASGTITTISVTGPISSTGGANPVLSMAQASASANGYLSSSDWTTFNNKQLATSAAIIATLGYTPADSTASGAFLQKANNLSDLTNAAAARSNLGLGSLAVGNSIDLGSASATGVLAIARIPAFSGDATIAAASNTILLSNSGVTAGTYNKVTVDSKGRVTSSSALSLSDVTTALGYTPAASGSSGAGSLLAANNLSDLASVTTARTNLGLGTLATLGFIDLGSASASGTLAIARLPAFSGDASTVAGSNSLVLSNSGVTAGTYSKVTVDAKGRVTSSSALSSSDVTTALGFIPLGTSATGVTSATYGSSTQAAVFSVDGFGRITSASSVSFSVAWSAVSAKPTTVAGYGITDAMSNALNSGLVFIGNGSNQATGVSISGDLTLNNTGVATLANSGVVSGSYAKVSVNAKGLVTSGSALNASDITAALGSAAVTSASATSLQLLGDVSGTLAATTVAKLQGRDVASTLPADGDVLTWNNTLGTWQPSAIVIKNQMCSAGFYLQGFDASGNKVCNPVSSATSMPTYTSVTTNYINTCATRSDNAVYCWGYNNTGQIGDNSTNTAYRPVSVRKMDGSILYASKVILGYYYGCAIQSSDSNVYCWGQNDYGQLGDNTATNRHLAKKISTLGAVIDIASSGLTTCAIDTTNKAWCWGYSGNGELGDNTTVSKYAPTATMFGIGQLAGVNKIAASGQTSCAYNTVSTTTVYCWGYNNQGQIGDGTSTSRHSAVAINLLTYDATITRVVSMSMGGSRAASYAHTCAVVYTNTARYKVYCWGYNGAGALMDGTQTGRLVPTYASLIGQQTEEVKVSAQLMNSCVLLPSTGTVSCIGYNNQGQLGNGNTTGSYLGFVQVKNFDGNGTLSVASLSENTGGYYDGTNSNLNHVCAITTVGTVACWGYNASGNLGNGNTTYSSIPVPAL